MFSQLTLKSSCAVRFICLKYSCGRFFSQWNVLTRVNFRSYKIRKFTCLVDFHSLYQLLYSQVYRKGLKLWISNVKIFINKWRRIKQKVAENVRSWKVTNDKKKKKKLRTLIYSKKARRVVLKINANVAAKDKIILSWPYQSFRIQTVFYVTILTWKNLCFTEKIHGLLLLIFFICLHNQLSSFNSIILHLSEKRDTSNRQ